MRIAIVAYFFPPVSQVGYRRPLRLARWLCERDHEVVVYAVSPATPELWNYTGVDPDLVSQVPDTLRIVRTPSIHGVKLLLALRDWFRGRARSALNRSPPDTAISPATNPSATTNEPPKTNPGTIGRTLRRFASWLDQLDPYTGWVLTTTPAMVMRGLVHRPDAIYVTAPPWPALITAVLAGIILRVPVHLDFRDPWLTNRYAKPSRVAKWMEAWVMRKGASIIANTESMAGSFKLAYPTLADKIHVVYNGYEAETQSRMTALRARCVSASRETFTVSHIGMLYANRMPRSLAASLAEVAVNWAGERPLRFRFVGSILDPAPLCEEFARRNVSHALELVGPVNTATAQEEQVKADVLLLLQSGTKDQIPAKIFEYAFAAVPILCVADQGSETAKLISEYQLGTVLHGNEGAQSWDAALAHLRDRVHVLPERFLVDFDGGQLASKIFDVIVQKSGERA